MIRRSLFNVVLLLAGAGLWARHALLASSLSSVVAYPLAVIILKGVAAALVGVGLLGGRGPLIRVVAWALSLLDALDDRLATLPPKTRGVVRAVGVGLAVSLVFSAAPGWNHVAGFLETRALDVFFKWRFPERSEVEFATGRAAPTANKQDDVVVLAIDDESIAHLGWPMPRTVYAQLIDAIAKAQPASVTFDVSLINPGREHPEWDLAIGESARKAGNVSFTFTVARAQGEASTALSQSALQVLDANSLQWTDAASQLPDYSELIGGAAVVQPVIEPVAQGARAVAMANVLLDGGDDVLRHSLMVARLGHRLLPSLSLRIAADALHVPLDQIRVFPGSHIELGTVRRIPIDELGRTLARYQGRHDTRGDGPFRYVSMWSVIRADASGTLVGNPLGEDQRFVLDENTKVSFKGAQATRGELESLIASGARVKGRAQYAPEPARILELEVVSEPEVSDPDFELLDEQTLRFSTKIGNLRRNQGSLGSLQGKHLLVGSTALAAVDLRSTPLGEVPGVEHHATMLANLLHGDFFHQTPKWLNALALVAVTLVAAGIGVALPPGLGLFGTVVLLLSMLTTAFSLSVRGVYTPVVGPSLSVASTYLLCIVLGARAARRAHLKAEAEREFIRHTFGRYLTEQVVEELLDSADGLRLGGKRDFVTIMMTDLRGFTSMCGSMEPENVVKLLNHYLEAMTVIINKYGGTIDEFIGDAILVVFGAPLPLEHAEARAIACAIEMLNIMPEVNAWNEGQKLPRVEMGIGVHSGEVVLGNIGSELRAKYGIVGSTINLTSRVESYTVGGQVLVSDQTRVRAGDLLTVGTSQVVSPKGVKGSMTIHEAVAIGAPYNVKLASAQEDLVKPRVPLVFRYAKIQSKQVSEVTHLAQVEALSELGLELNVPEELAALTDLQLRLLDGDQPRPGDVYGKIIRANVRPNVVYLRLTSVPPELRRFFEEARGANPVPDSPLVSV